MMDNFQAAKNVVKKIEQAGFEAVFVGGAVRDFLLGKEQHDVDIATSALPTEIKAIFNKTVDVGIEHGTVLILDEGEPIEVTTYRTESTYSDFRRPDEVQFVRSLEEDLKRRDFTMNAMAIRSSGEIVDLFHGKQDIESRCIRAVGNPTERFTEDALRMLRAIRFAAQLGFLIEEQTLNAIKQCAPTIMHIAKERISAEMSKLWESAYVSKGIHYLVESGLSVYMLGNFSKFTCQFSTFNTCDTKVGWAYLAYLNNEVQELVSFYRLSKKTRQFMEQVVQASNKMHQNWGVLDTYNFDEEVIEAAYHCLIWSGRKVDYELELLLSEKKMLPVQKIQDLAITGRHLIEWSEGKGGPWLKKALDEILEAVLQGQLENNPRAIKEWFKHEFNKE